MPLKQFKIVIMDHALHIVINDSCPASDKTHTSTVHPFLHYHTNTKPESAIMTVICVNSDNELSGVIQFLLKELYLLSRSFIFS